jgi:hypothetical protein
MTNARSGTPLYNLCDLVRSLVRRKFRQGPPHMPCSKRYAQSAAQNGICRLLNVVRTFRSFPTVSTGYIFYEDVAVEWRRYVVMVSRQKRRRKFQVRWFLDALCGASAHAVRRKVGRVIGEEHEFAAYPEEAKQNWLATSSFSHGPERSCLGPHGACGSENACAGGSRLVNNSDAGGTQQPQESDQSSALSFCQVWRAHR